MKPDPRHGDPVPVLGHETAGLVVAMKALVARAGGQVEFDNPELEAAAKLHARVDATPELMVIELVEGEPPDQPRYATAGH
jgi:hypothetical protein